VSIKPLPASPADAPAPFDLPDVAAVQAVYRGNASEDQQKRAMEWVIKGAAQIGSQSYRAGDSHATAFVEGRRFVGAQILSLLALSVEDLKKRKATNG
jgi:hypothetical protein